jgi:hypothetical protein
VLAVNVKSVVEIILNTSIFLFQNASAQAALQAASALSGQNETQGGPNTVLRVIIEHMVYPVTLEVLCQVSDDSHVEYSFPILLIFPFLLFVSLRNSGQP